MHYPMRRYVGLFYGYPMRDYRCLARAAMARAKEAKVAGDCAGVKAAVAYARSCWRLGCNLPLDGIRPPV